MEKKHFLKFLETLINYWFFRRCQARLQPCYPPLFDNIKKPLVGGYYVT